MRHNIEELFTVVKAYHEKEELSVKVNVQHDSLRPTLRSYQKRAVSWMLHKEGYGQKKENEGKCRTAHTCIYCKQQYFTLLI